MFGATGSNLPYRQRRDLARSQQLRDLTRRRPDLANQAPWSMRDQNTWNRDFLGGVPRRFEELEDSPLSSMSSDNVNYGSPYTPDFRRRNHSLPRKGVPFDEAADAMSQAIQFAIEHCKGIRKHFEDDVERSSISLWSPPKVIDALWAMNVEWNGVNAAQREPNPSQQPSPEVVTYQSIAKRLFRALEELKTSGRPRMEYFEDNGSKLSPAVVRSTLNKFYGSMQGIEVIVKSVRKDRKLMERLIKELESAAELLTDIEDLWRPAVKSRRGKARARWEDDEDFVWPDYRGE